MNEFCLIVSILLVILGFVFKRSKTLYIIQFLWLWILIGLNIGGADYHNYEVMYDTCNTIADVHSPEILYRLICYWSNTMGFDFLMMNAILSFVSVGTIFYIISKHTKNKCMVASMFMIFPFVDNVIQKRFFYATAIMFVAFHFLLGDGIKKKYRKRLLYILLCLVAAQIHSSMYFFLIFILVDFENIKFNKKFILLSVIASFLLITFVPSFLSTVFNSSKIYDYFYDESMRLDSILKVVGFCIVHIIFVFLIDKIIDAKRSKELAKIKNIMNLSLVFLPFYFYNSVFFRIIRLCIILGYIGIAKEDEYKEDIRRTRLTNSLLVGYLVANFLFFYCLSGTYGYNILVKPIFEQNVVTQALSEEFAK